MSHSIVLTNRFSHQRSWQKSEEPWFDTQLGVVSMTDLCFQSMWQIFCFPTRHVKHIRVSCTFHFRYPISCTNKRQDLICFGYDLLFLFRTSGLQEQRASCVVFGISPLQRCLPPVHMNFCFWRQTCKLTMESNPEECVRDICRLLEETWRTWLFLNRGKGNPGKSREQNGCLG